MLICYCYYQHRDGEKNIGMCQWVNYEYINCFNNTTSYYGATVGGFRSSNYCKTKHFRVEKLGEKLPSKMVTQIFGKNFHVKNEKTLKKKKKGF